MNKCLVTKLNGSCDNTDLLRIGEMRVHFSKVDSPTASTQGKTFAFVKDAQLEIIGDAYFTDKTLSNAKIAELFPCYFRANEIASINTGKKYAYLWKGDFPIRKILKQYP